MGAKELLVDLQRHRLIALDTSPFIYHFQQHPKYSPLTQQLFEFIQSGMGFAITSVLTLQELMVLPLREQNLRVAEEYQAVLRSFPNLEVLDIGWETALLAAEIRAQFNFSVADCFQCAVARQADAQILVTNDVRLKRLTHPSVIVLEDYVSQE